jgi:uncharacterized damage-inducible protein DinB
MPDGAGSRLRGPRRWIQDRRVMSHPEHFVLLARYNRWMNGRLYEVAATLSDQERKRDLRAFFRSVHGTLNHLLLADRFLLGRLRTLHGESAALNEGALEPDFQPARELFADFATLRDERDRTDATIEQWTAELTAAVLARTLPDGRPFWRMAAHFFNHQTHHRGQVTTLLMQLGRDPGVTDLSALPRGA